MLGLTFEKLFLVAVVAALVIGPKRLPVHTRQLTDLIRSMRSFVEVARTRAESEIGVPFDRAQWQSLDPRQYDPRRILREALGGPSGGDAVPAAAPGRIEGRERHGRTRSSARPRTSAS
jgi:sec-independent protein translocase protein TatB